MKVDSWITMKGNKMNQVYLVYESWGTCDDSSCVGAFLDESKADEYINEHMIPRKKELEQHEKCKECRGRDEIDFFCDHEYDEVFRLESECPVAKVETDRNGKYCENDISDYYSMNTNSYWKVPIELIG